MARFKTIHAVSWTLVAAVAAACNAAHPSPATGDEASAVDDQSAALGVPYTSRGQGSVHRGHGRPWPQKLNVQVGPRPYYLVEDMDEGPLKRSLQKCSEGPLERTDFSIGHRGAPLQFPEHTKVSYEAAARMGAGIIECDVTFTKDKQLVCRHSQCDLHTTTTRRSNTRSS